MKQSLQIKQGQSLAMTQQLQQSIKMLQYSAAELVEFVDGEVEKNPLLAVDDGNGEVAAVSESSPSANEGEQSVDANDVAVDSVSHEESATEKLDVSSEDMWGGETDSALRYEGATSGSFSNDSGGGFISDIIEQRLSEEISLKDHLMEQIQLDIVDVPSRMIAAYLVDLLDEDGYLREDLSKIAEQLGADVADIEAVLEQLQQCDPSGVFARDLTECLQLQLIERDRFDPVMQKMLANLDMVGDGNLKKIAKVCGVSEDDVLDMLAEIRGLNPKPSSDFLHEEVETMIPDVLVRRIGDGDWRVTLNPDVLPKLLVHREYHAELIGSSREKEDKKFLNEQLGNANWLMKALDQRANTMLKVSTEILHQQRLFFERGIRFLKPMTLKEVAVKVDLHESSVSRVTNNKFMATGRGVFELKYFFSSSISGASGDGKFSSKSVMHMIKEIVDAEEDVAILSDDAIAAMLKERGVDCARRTVVKYRTKMDIPSSVQRRRAKKAL